tara:strand:+ start:146 stop:496 length:351 start_codon:yes stop_codon:yes gene_type:complete
MPIVLQLRVHEKDVDMNPNVWYLYAVHEKQIISAKNILTIRVKKSLTTHWSDLNFKENSEKILEDINKIITLLSGRGTVVLPLEALTKEVAEMEEHCPKTKKFVDKQIERLMKYGY